MYLLEPGLSVLLKPPHCILAIVPRACLLLPISIRAAGSQLGEERL